MTQREKLTPGMQKLLDVSLAVRCPDEWCQAESGESCKERDGAVVGRNASLTRSMLALLRLIEERKP